MTKPLQRDAIYLKRHFDAEIIVLCVRWYITYKLSYRDLAAMMAERALWFRTPPSCAALFATRPSSRSVGAGSRDPSAARGVSTRLTSQSRVTGTTFLAYRPAGTEGGRVDIYGCRCSL
jgi:hypothetical protein